MLAFVLLVSMLAACSGGNNGMNAKNSNGGKAATTKKQTKEALRESILLSECAFFLFVSSVAWRYLLLFHTSSG